MFLSGLTPVILDPHLMKLEEGINTEGSRQSVRQWVK